ncbi:carbohydrate kinase [Arcanobacterium haemolyticum]|nr:carbohydrate kinase [Arcanobacterium haemolyticum]
MSFLVIGEALIDELDSSDGSTQRIPGGSMLNVAIGLRRLDRTVRLVTDVGLDADGELLQEYAASNGLELWLRSDDERTNPTSVAKARVNSQGRVSYDFEFTWDIQDTPVSGACKLDLEVLAPTCVAFGSFPCHIQPGSAKVRRWIEQLRESATIFYDPNVRPTAFADCDRMRAEVEDFVAMSDIVKVSMSDLHAIYGADADTDAIAKSWLASGPALVVLTQGADGATMYGASGYVLQIPAPQVDVVDTIGAGAAFFSALADGLARLSLDGAFSRPLLRRMSLTNLQTLGAYAVTAAAITVSRSGANPPTRDELIDRHEFYQTSGVVGTAVSRTVLA